MTEDQRRNPKIMVGIAGGLIAVIALFLVYQWMISSNTEDAAQPQAEPAPVQAAAPAEAAAPPAAPSEASTSVAPKLVEDNIVDAPVPEDSSLAKEEIAKLDDIQKQLNDQESTLKAQHADADQLIKLKEEQIKTLEAQMNAQQ
jgi:type IV secretory pathway VirB10-like protein